MTLVVPADKADEALRVLAENGQDAYFLGEIAQGEKKEMCIRDSFVTVLDESCLSQPAIAVSAGHIGFQVQLAPQDLIRLAKATAADLTQGDLA